MPMRDLELVPLGRKRMMGSPREALRLGFYSRPEPGWNLWGDPEGHCPSPLPPLGKGSYARILLGNICLLLPLGITGGSPGAAGEGVYMIQVGSTSCPSPISCMLHFHSSVEMESQGTVPPQRPVSMRAELHENDANDCSSSLYHTPTTVLGTLRA